VSFNEIFSSCADDCKFGCLISHAHLQRLTRLQSTTTLLLNVRLSTSTLPLQSSRPSWSLPQAPACSVPTHSPKMSCFAFLLPTSSAFIQPRP
jgi:hypothetical protein